jgi:hypothetical protein
MPAFLSDHTLTIAEALGRRQCEYEEISQQQFSLKQKLTA